MWAFISQPEEADDELERFEDKDTLDKEEASIPDDEQSTDASRKPGSALDHPHQAYDMQKRYTIAPSNSEQIL